ncbi:O-antigen ligase family protein [Sphingorhabdus lacus]|uniref:O-antigen ligase family protein n=1 Tax=Sphingorhabdus lacus TaxID=392610 RepID=UPI0035942B6F
MNPKVAIKGLDSWLVALCIVAMLPTIFVLSTWDLDGVLSPASYAIRHFSLPIIVGELCVVIFAMRKKFSIYSAFAEMGRVPKTLTILWLIFAFLPVLFVAEDMSLSAFSTLQYALHGVFLASLIYLAQSSAAAKRETALINLTLGAFIYVGFLVAFVLIIPDKASFPWTLRLPSGTNVRQIGYFIAIVAITPISLLLFSRRNIAALCFVVIFLVTFIAWTGSRGALVGLFFGPALAAFMLRRSPTKTRAGLLVMSFAFGLAASLPLPNPAPEFGLVRMASSLSQDELGSGRSFVWKSTITEIKKSPWIGHGSGSFKQNMQSIYDFNFNQPHQFVLQYIYDWGLFGGGAAGLLLLLLFLSSLGRAREVNDAAAYAAITALCTVAVIGMIDGALYYPFSIVIAAAVVAIGNIEESAKNEQGNGEINSRPTV